MNKDIIIKKINLHIYGDIKVTILFTESMKTGIEYLEKKYHIFYDSDLEEQSIALTSVLSGPKTGWVPVIILHPKASPMVVSHECLHMTWKVFEYLGIEVSATNNEHQAYLLGYLVEQINKLQSQLYAQSCTHLPEKRDDPKDPVAEPDPLSIEYTPGPQSTGTDQSVLLGGTTLYFNEPSSTA